MKVKTKSKILNMYLLASFFILGFSICLTLVSASLNVRLSDQGTGVAYSNGTPLSSGTLTVLIYDAVSGGNLIYNETFANNISEGSWNVMLGSGVNLSLEFGKVYYKDYLIAGEGATFDGSDRQAFYSPLGDISGEDINNNSNLTIYNLNATGLIYGNGSQLTSVQADTIAANINLTGNVTITERLTVPTLNVSGNATIGDRIIFSDNVNRTLYANATSIYYFNGTSWIDLTSTGNASSESYWSRNTTTNITSLANTQDNINLTSSNITTTGTGFFGWLGSLVNRITTLFAQDININGTITGGAINITTSDGNVVTSGNITANYMNLSGDLYVDDIYASNDTVYIGGLALQNINNQLYWNNSEVSTDATPWQNASYVRLKSGYGPNVNISGNVLILSNLSVGDKIRFGNNVNQTIFVNTTSIYYYNGTSYTDLASSSSVFIGANSTNNGTSGLVPMPTNDSYQQCLLGNGSWGDCGTNYWSRNSTTNITSLANSQDSVNLTSSNVTTTGTGFFGWLGSLTSKITKIWTTSLNVNNTIEFRDENHSLSANDTSVYYYNGSIYSDLISSEMVGANSSDAGTSGLVPAPANISYDKCLLGNGSWGDCGANYWSRNATSNITSLANSQDNVNLTSSNITTTGTGFFGWLGSLVNRVTKISVKDIDFNGTINGSGNIVTTGNLSGGNVKFDNNETRILNANTTSIYYYNGSTYIDLTSGEESYFVRNSTSNITSLENSQDKVGIGTSSPATKLDVNGSTTIRGDINVTGDIYVSNDSIYIGDAALSNSGGELQWGGTAVGVGSPTGSLIAFAGSSAPAGWLMADGSAVSRTTYSDLFVVVSTTYGVGDGNTTFNLPDLRDRMALGANTKALGSSGGSLDHTHTGPSHNHTYNEVISHNHSVDPPATESGNNDVSHKHTVSGGAHAHSITTFGSASATHGHTEGFRPAGAASNYAGSGSYDSAHESVAHTHTVANNNANHKHTTDIASFTSGGASGEVATGTTASDGDGDTGTANAPYLAINYIIKY